MPKPANEKMPRGAEREVAPEQRAERAERQRDRDQEHDLAEQLGGRDRARGGALAVIGGALLAHAREAYPAER